MRAAVKLLVFCSFPVCLHGQHRYPHFRHRLRCDVHVQQTCGWYSIYPCRPNPGAGGTFWGTALLSFLWNSNGRFNNHFYNSQIRFPFSFGFGLPTDNYRLDFRFFRNPVIVKYFRLIAYIREIKCQRHLPGYFRQFSVLRPKRCCVSTAMLS